MSLLRFIDPRQILVALDRIDADPSSWTLDRRAALRRVVIVLACVSVCLLLLHYAKSGRNFYHLMQWLATLQDLPANHYIQPLHQAGWYPMAVNAWWAGWHLVAFLLIPWLVCRYLLKASTMEMGWRWHDTHRHWLGYILLLTPILFFVYLVSLGEEFVDHYPFYTHAGRSWVDFLGWQLLYMSQFVVLEFFFRGFMLNALRPAMGANAIWVMIVPYMMIHLPKPWLEATGSILFGLFLGILALQSRSIWGGVLVHAGVALSMDMAALLRKGQFPTQWWPF